MQHKASPLDREARLVLKKLPPRIRRRLDDLAAASGCPTLEIVQSFQEGAGHPEFPDPPSTAASTALKTDHALAAESAAAAKPRSSRPAKGSKT
jgi:hypothetical protein